MTVSASAVVVPRPSPLDWDDLALALERFSAATGLYVCTYDASGGRRHGPCIAGGVARLLSDRGVFADGRAGQRMERRLVDQVFESGEADVLDLGNDFQVRALPVLLDGQVVAVVAYGWVFTRFPTGLGCQRLARDLETDGTALWAAARNCQPVPPQRLTVLSTLLDSILTSAVRHANAVGHLTALAQMRETFLACVSHELRAPLSVLSMRVDMLLRGTLDDRLATRDSLLKMKEYVRAESHLIEDLIDVAKTRTGQFTLQRQTVDLATILQASVNAQLPHSGAKGIALESTVAEDAAEGITVLADPLRLQQVFWNLLSNAIKFTPEGGAIRISVVREDSSSVVTIQDNGSGIDAAMLPNVFSAFTRQDTNNVQGLGLGLSIAQHIVAAHAGEIWVESPGKGGGSTFFVRLPIVAEASEALSGAR